MNAVRESYPYPNVTISRRILKGENYPFPHFFTGEHFKSFCRYSTVLEYRAAQICRKKKRKKQYEYSIIQRGKSQDLF